MKSAEPTMTPPTNNGLGISPLWVSGEQDPFDLFHWERKKSEIRSSDGEVFFSQDAVEAPADWSQMAVDIAASKYFRKSGVPRDKSGNPGEEHGRESSVKQLIGRVVRSLTMAGQEQGGYFTSTQDAESFCRELTFLLASQKASFNSPVWFNLGLHREYGIHGNGHQWAWDQEKEQVVKIDNAYERPQCSACFIQSVDDDMNSIFELVKREARIFKYGSGSGTNFSALRGKQEKLSGGGLSSGLMSFLEVLDRGAGATKSGGITRRAAKMVCLDIDHPEVREFIRWKWREEEKAQALIQAGFSPGMDGEAYHTVSGQNSNNSVRVNQAFMQALDKNELWPLTARLSGEILNKVSAKDLWQEIGEAAWNCADPGLQFDDPIQAWHTCPQSGKIKASNPCSEFMFLDDTACNLASLNLVQFIDEAGNFLVDEFQHAARLLILAQDILVDHSGYPTAPIAENSHRFRPLGLGYTNLGALLMILGLPYESEEGRNWAASITSLLTATAYQTSAEIAASKGPFAGFVENRKDMLRVIRKHSDHSLGLSNTLPALTSLLERANQSWQRALKLAEKSGYRNSQVTVIAPTGTISFLMDCDTTGIEPEFSLIKHKRLAGGGDFKMINQSIPRALNQLGYSTEQVEEVTEALLSHGDLEKAPHLDRSHYAVFACAGYSGENPQLSISPEGHLLMMAAAQPFLSGAISKTVNLPANTSAEDILRIYRMAWDLQLKAIAIYRDTSKTNQPLRDMVKDHQKSKTSKSHSSTALSTENSIAKTAESLASQNSVCGDCGFTTLLPSGSCFRCPNCGSESSCS